MAMKTNPDEADVVAALELRNVFQPFAAGTRNRAALTPEDRSAIAAIRAASARLASEVVRRERTGCTPLERERMITAPFLTEQVADYLELIEADQAIVPERAANGLDLPGKASFLDTARHPVIESAAIREHAEAIANNLTQSIGTFVAQRRNFEQLQIERTRAAEGVLANAEDADPILRHLIAGHLELRRRIRRRDQNEAIYRLAGHDLGSSIGYLLPIDPQTGKRMAWKAAADVLELRLSRMKEAA